MDELQETVEQLRAQAQVFNAALAQLESSAPAIRQNAQALAHWKQLVSDGRSIRTAIQTTARMLDGARKWVARTFQTDALESIPFASDVVVHTAKGSLSSIQNWLDRANAFLPTVRQLIAKFSALPEEERTKLAALPADQPQQKIWPAIALLGVFGVLIWAFGNAGMPEFMKGDDDES